MASRLPELRLHEELLLLALRDDRGTVHSAAAMYTYALAGGLLAELLLDGHISLDGSRQPFVTAVSTGPLRDELLDECLRRIRDSRRRQRLATWATRFAGLRDLRHRIAGGLCARGILRLAEEQILLIFKRRVYPEIDHRYEERIVARVRDAIFGEERMLDGRTAALVALANGAGLLSVLFPKKGLRARRARIEQIAAGERVGAATRAAVEAVRAAATAAAVAAIFAVASS